MSTDPAAESTPADRVRAAVLAVEGVAGLSGGALGQIGTYLPGRRVAGVRLTPEVAEVHVTVRQGAPVREVAGLVRLAVAGLVGTPVDVVVEDVVP